MAAPLACHRYHETTVSLGFNYRESFNTFVIRLGKDDTLSWLVGHGTEKPKVIHSVKATLTEPMCGKRHRLC